MKNYAYAALLAVLTLSGAIWGGRCYARSHVLDGPDMERKIIVEEIIYETQGGPKGHLLLTAKHSRSLKNYLKAIIIRDVHAQRKPHIKVLQRRYKEDGSGVIEERWWSKRLELFDRIAVILVEKNLIAASEWVEKTGGDKPAESQKLTVKFRDNKEITLSSLQPLSDEEKEACRTIIELLQRENNEYPPIPER